MNQPKRILVVDDDRKQTDLLCTLLTRVGKFEVLCENRSECAVSAAHAFLPDAVILDVEMPGMDGGDVAAELKLHPVLKDVPILFLSALVAPGESRTASSTAPIYLGKPFELPQLLRTLNDLLANSVVDDLAPAA